jgi:hypothetical protein
MERCYDIFEKMPDGSMVWRGVVTGYENAIAALKELATETSNELHLLHLSTHSVVATINENSLKQMAIVSELSQQRN